MFKISTTIVDMMIKYYIIASMYQVYSTPCFVDKHINFVFSPRFCSKVLSRTQQKHLDKSEKACCYASEDKYCEVAIAFREGILRVAFAF